MGQLNDRHFAGYLGEYSFSTPITTAEALLISMSLVPHFSLKAIKLLRADYYNRRRIYSANGGYPPAVLRTMFYPESARRNCAAATTLLGLRDDF